MTKWTHVTDVEEIEPELWPAGASTGYRIRYRSGDRISSGSVFLPDSTRNGEEFPLLTWAHCFVGLDHHNAPSRRGLPEVERRHLSGWLDNGFAVAAADYRGLDGCGLNPFPRPAPIAADVLDICPAARDVDERIGNTVVAGGFCQGASAILSASGSYADPGLDYVGAVSLSPPDYFSYFTEVTRDSDFPADALVLTLLAGLRVGDSRFDPEEFLTGKGRELLDAVTSMSIPEMREVMAPYTVGDLGIHNLTQRMQVSRALQECQAAPQINTKPFFLCAIELDPLTPRESTRRTVDELSSQGAEVTFRSYSGRHLDILKLAASDIEEWATREVRGNVAEWQRLR